MSKQFIERRIAIGLITNEKYLREVSPVFNQELLKDEAAKKIASWCIRYFTKHSKAPLEDIGIIYESYVRRGKLRQEEAEDIGEILDGLSGEYQEQSENNPDVLIDETFAYFDENRLIQLAEDVKSEAERGNLLEANTLIAKNRQIQRTVGINHDFFADDIDRTKKIFEDVQEPIIEYPGKLGSLLNRHLVRGGFVGLLGPEKTGKCLDKDTLILLPDGRVKTIQKVVEDRDPKIMSLNEKTMKLEIREISKHWYNGLKQACKITTRTGRTIITTLKHPYLTPDGWKKVGEIKIGERIAVPCNLPVFGNVSYPEYKIKLLAYLIAEGGLYLTRDIRFCSTYPDIQKDFIDCANKMGDVVTKKKNNNKDFSVITHPNFRQKAGKNNTGNWLNELGLVGKRSKDKFIPDFVFSLPKEQITLFLNTLFTCDGTIYRGGIEYSSASENIIRQVYHLLLRFGIVSTIDDSWVKGKQYWRITLFDRDGVVNFIDKIGFSFHKGVRAKTEREIQIQKKRSNCFFTTLPPQILSKIYNETKGRIPKVFQEVIRTARKNGTNTSLNVVKRMSSFSKEAEKYSCADIMWDEVVKKELVGERETYDLTVPDTHNFVAADIIAHNTFWCLDIAFQAQKSNKKVAFFAAGDMNREEMELRKYIYMAKKSNEAEYCGQLMVPVLDCFWNQNGDCVKGGGMAPIRGDKPPPFKDLQKIYMTAFEEYGEEHEPCTKCLGQKEFHGAPWFKVREKVDPLTWKEAYNIERRFQKRFRNAGWKLADYPSYTLTTRMIDNQLSLWHDEGFTADVVLVDYPDIMGPDDEDRKLDFRQKENMKWLKLRGLAHKWHCLIVCPTQADAGAYGKDWLDLSNYSEDKRKYSHTTAFFGLNQTDGEAELGLFRINQLIVRSGKRGKKYATICQRLEMGRPFLASY